MAEEFDPVALMHDLSEVKSDICVRIPLEIYREAVTKGEFKGANGSHYSEKEARYGLVDGLEDVGVVGSYANAMINMARELFVAGKEIPDPAPKQRVDVKPQGHEGFADNRHNRNSGIEF